MMTLEHIRLGIESVRTVDVVMRITSIAASTCMTVAYTMYDRFLYVCDRCLYMYDRFLYVCDRH